MSAHTLVFGDGWLGRQFAERLPGAQLTQTDVADEYAVSEELDAIKPRAVVNCAGRTGSPNIDSLEDDPGGTYRSNVAGPIVLGSACRARDIHFTHLGSGCIYEGDGGGAGFAEEDPPNFDGSLYARSKIVAEVALRDLDALQLRIRLPMASEPAPRNLLTKLLAFDEVVSIANSVTILDDFWAPALELIARRERGVWNMVNDGAEYHDRLLALWRERVAPDHEFGTLSAEALEGRLVARRSNCLLSTQKLHAAGLAMPHVDEALPRLIDAYAANQSAMPGP